ncbi:MAG: hypothetical protein FWE80_02755 [Oscillospiraceae bacterium]|nr:hypothetical protein [Oscillospiraceae bacterium]
MKKFLVLALVAMLVLSFGSVSVLAANPIITATGSDSADVKGTYVEGSAASAVYSVDLEWGALEFTYTDAGTGTWNPGNHSYSGGAAASWACDDPGVGDKIKVTNHSNRAVIATFSFAPESGADFAAITGAFTGTGITSNAATLGAGVVGQYATAANVTATLTLSGALGSSVNTQTTIGAVTVTLSVPG